MGISSRINAMKPACRPTLQMAPIRQAMLQWLSCRRIRPNSHLANRPAEAGERCHGIQEKPQVVFCIISIPADAATPPQHKDTALNLFTLTTASAAMLLAVATQPTAAQTDTAAAKAPHNAWTSQCGSATRKQPLACAMEQRVVLKETGQQLAKLTIKTGPDSAEKPTMLLQLPLGVSLRKGVSLTVDDGETANFDIQTCEASGCYVGDVVSDALLAAMRKGSQINIGLENLQQKEVKFAFSLNGFSAALDNIR